MKIKLSPIAIVSCVLSFFLHFELANGNEVWNGIEIFTISLFIGFFILMMIFIIIDTGGLKQE